MELRKNQPRILEIAEAVVTICGFSTLTQMKAAHQGRRSNSAQRLTGDASMSGAVIFEHHCPRKFVAIWNKGNPKCWGLLPI